MPQELPPELLIYLRSSRPVILSTIDEEGWPYSRPLYWCTAKSPRLIRFALEAHSASLRHLSSNPRVGIQALGDDLIYFIKGEARVVKDRMESQPEHSLVEVRVKLVRSQLGGQDRALVEIRGPSYTYRPGKEGEEWARMEKAVFEELAKDDER